IDLGRRLLFGFLVRVGWRVGEAIGGEIDPNTKKRRIPPLTWEAVDLERGVLTLDKNKTDDPRIVPLAADVVRALKAWKELYPIGEAKPTDPVFVEYVATIDRKVREHGRTRLPNHLRADVFKAKIDRAALLTAATDTHAPLHVHDLRASMVTVALANDRSERWICDRTGHKSHAMIERYRRQARTFAEMNVGDWAPLDEAIPELAPAPKGAVNGGSRGQQPSRSAARRRIHTRISRKIRRVAARSTPTSALANPLHVGSNPILTSAAASLCSAIRT
ncbi:MAG TPA: site-specific integrase, partial [Polyangiaceae bacterium]